MSDMFFTVIGNSSNGFLRILYPSCIIKNINDVFYNLLKCKYKNIKTQSEIIGKDIYDAFNVFDDDISCKEINIALNIAVEKQNYSDIYMFNVDGEEKFYKLIYETVMDEGINKEILVTCFDITREISEKAEAEIALKKEEEFFINITHELKTPLNVIFSINQVMDVYLGKNSLNKNKEQIRRNNKLIKQNCYRLIKLVNNLIDLSKLESGNLKLNLVNVDIVKVIKSIIESVSEYVKDTGMNVVFSYDINEKILAADIDKVERVLLNLLSNAIKFSYQGSKIDVILRDKGEFVELLVKDYGVGIEQENIDLIFKRYGQVENTFIKNTLGSGVGLSLVKSIVELHEGNIRVESQLGKGSTFIVMIPVKKVDNTYIKNEMTCLDNKVEKINIEFSDIYSI